MQGGSYLGLQQRLHVRGRWCVEVLQEQLQEGVERGLGKFRPKQAAGCVCLEG